MMLAPGGPAGSWSINKTKGSGLSKQLVESFCALVNPYPLRRTFVKYCMYKNVLWPQGGEGLDGRVRLLLL
jgi:hypothetical protein